MEYVEEQVICIFGDSTAWGAWDMEKGGWVNRLWLYCAKNDSETMLYNLSISGGDSAGILERFEREAKAREADVLIFQTGGNDAAYEGSEQKPRVAPETFEQNLSEIFTRARKITDMIFFIGFRQVDESKTTPVPWADVSYVNKSLEQYNSIAKRVCEARAVPFLGVYELLENSDLEDGVHPNAKGHKKLFDAIKTFLEEHKLKLT